MTVHRLTPLPEGSNRGRLIVTAPVAMQTRTALQGFRGPEGRHEGIVFWLGRRFETDILVASAIVPDCMHGRQQVSASPAAVGAVSRKARALRLGVVTQVHSHPGDDTRHSDGDDRLILLPFEGMFSLVVASFGDGGMTQAAGLGLHQYQDRRWVRIPASCTDAMIIVPSLVGTVE